MTGWKQKLEAFFAAVAFAEADQRATALEIMPAPKAAHQFAWMSMLNDTFAGVAFAEAGLPETAIDLVKKPPIPSKSRMATFLEEVGLSGAPLHYGVARI